MKNSLVDALNAEMLGDVQKIHTQLQSLKAEMPGFLNSVKTDCASAAGAMKKSFDDFHAQSIALAEFVKKRQIEVAGEIEKAHAVTAAATEKSLADFTKYFWLIAGIAAAGFFINLAVLIFILQKHN